MTGLERRLTGALERLSTQCGKKKRRRFGRSADVAAFHKGEPDSVFWTACPGGIATASHATDAGRLLPLNRKRGQGGEDPVFRIHLYRYSGEQPAGRDRTAHRTNEVRGVGRGEQCLDEQGILTVGVQFDW